MVVKRTCTCRTLNIFCSLLLRFLLWFNFLNFLIVFLPGENHLEMQSPVYTFCRVYVLLDVTRQLCSTALSNFINHLFSYWLSLRRVTAYLHKVLLNFVASPTVAVIQSTFIENNDFWLF